MKNLFFILVSLSFFITSCTKDFIEPTIVATDVSESVSVRSETVEVSTLVTSAEIIIVDGVLELTEFDTNLSELSIAPTQDLKFIDLSNGNAPVNIQVTVKSFEIIIVDGVLEFTAPGVNFENLEISDNQILSFN